MSDLETLRMEKLDELDMAHVGINGALIVDSFKEPFSLPQLWAEIALLTETNFNGRTPCIDALIAAGYTQPEIIARTTDIELYFYRYTLANVRLVELQSQVNAATTIAELNNIVIDFSDLLTATYPAV